MVFQEKILDITERLQDLYKFLNLEEKEKEILILEEKTHQDKFWENSKNAEKILKQISVIKSWIASYNTVKNNLDELKILNEFYINKECDEKELIHQYKKSISSLEELELKNMLSAKEDSFNAIININPGAGGTESQDWAEMIMRMYLMWAEKNNYKVKELDMQRADPAGIKSVTLEFEGDFAFGNLKGENGVHRLVRISPFDSNAKRHTSFASVFVYPLANHN